MQRTGLIILLAVSLLLAGSACSRSGGSAGKSEGSSAATTTTASARKAPGFKLTSLQGETVDFARYGGKVILVDFWATWCPPCRRSIPHLADLHRKYADRGFEVVGVSLDNADRGVVAQFAHAFQIPYTVVMGNPQLAQTWDVGPGIPAAFLIDRQGGIVEKIVGYRELSYFDEKIRKLL